MKKIPVVFSVITALLVLAGCSSADVPAEAANRSSEAESTSNVDSSGSGESVHSYSVENDFGLELPNTRAGEFAAKALAADPWGDMVRLETDEELAETVSDKLKFDMLEDSCFIAGVTSGRKFLILIAKPTEENDETVNGLFDHIFHQYKNEANRGFSAAEKEDALGAVTGVTGSGYYYVVVHKDGARIADVMVG